MPLPDNYFENKLREREKKLPQSQGGQIEDTRQNITKSLRGSRGAKINYMTKQVSRPAVSYIPQILSEQILGQSIPQWSSFSMPKKANLFAQAAYKKMYGRSLADYEKANFWKQREMNVSDLSKLTWKLAIKPILNIPKYIAKAPAYLSFSALNLESRALDKLTNKSEISFPSQVDLPLLGKVTTAGSFYDNVYSNLKKQGFSDDSAKIWGALGASSETLSEGLMASVAGDVVNYLTRPRWKNLTSKIAGPDYRPFQAKQTGETIKNGSKITEFSSPKQNPNILLQRMSKSQAKEFGGNANNTFYMLKPKGKGKAEYSVVQRRKSLVDATKDFFAKKWGKSKIVQGENGPLIKLYSEDVKYDPYFLQNKALSESTIDKMAQKEYNVGITTATESKSQLINNKAIQKAKVNNQNFDEFVNEQFNNIKNYETRNKFDVSNGVIEENVPKENLGSINAKGEGTIRSKNFGNVKNGSTSRLIENIKNSPEGFTLNLDGTPVTSGFAVSPYKNKEVILDNVDNKSVIDFYEKNKDLLFSSENENKLGGWLNKKNNKYYLDIANVLNDKNKAIITAIKNDQIAIFDLKTKKELNTFDTFKSELKELWNKSATEIPKESKLGVKSEGKSIDPFDPLKAEKTEMPSIMARPLKGFENSLVTDKQVRQTIGLANEREIDDVMIQAIAKTLTTKDNIYDLTQNELYDVSEAIRAFPKLKKGGEPWDIGRFSSFWMEARNWMSATELEAEARGMSLPLDSEVRIPIESGIRLSRIFRDSWNEEFDQIGGKYTGAKYAEEARIISAYVEGDEKVILNNSALSATAKKEMIKIGDWFKRYFKESFNKKELGLTYSEYVDNYLPKLRKAGSIHLLYKENEIPPQLKVFAQYEREGQFNVLEDNIFVLAQIYNNATSKIKFLKEPYEHAMKVISNAPPVAKERATDWVQEVMGRRDKYEKAFNDWGKRLSQRTKGIIPENISQQILDLALSNTYAAALGLPRFAQLPRNLIGQSLLLPYAEFGPEYFKGLVQWWNKKGFQELIKRGFSVKSGVIYGAEASEQIGKGPIGKLVDYYKKLNELSMKPYGWTDLTNRLGTYGATIDRFAKNWNLFKKGKINEEQFKININMDGFSPTVQKVLNNLFAKNTKESLFQAQELMAKEKLDAIQFGYRRGSGAAFHHGLRGKALGQFSLYTWGYASMVREWIVRKQWAKIIRWLGMSEAIKRSFEETVGVDVSKWVGVGPLSLPVSPLVRVAMMATEGTENALGNMTKALNDNYKEIIRTLKLSTGVAGGIGMQRWGKVLKSVKEYETSPYPVFDPATGEKAFPLRAANGKLIRPLNFKDLLLYGFGFQDSKGNKEWDILNKVDKEKHEKEMKEGDAMNALIQGDFKKFNKIYIDNQLDFNPSKRLDSYQKSILQRVYERMGNRDKIKYFNLVIPIIYGK